MFASHRAAPTSFNGSRGVQGEGGNLTSEVLRWKTAHDHFFSCKAIEVNML